MCIVFMVGPVVKSFFPKVEVVSMKSCFKKSSVLILLATLSAGVIFSDSIKAVAVDSSEDAKSAFKRIEALAAQGNAEAQAQLADLYLAGKGVAKDAKKALEYYKKAAELKVLRAELFLAEAYYSGKDVAQDYKEALKWYAQAAQEGSAEAQHRLGEMYRDGLGVARKNAAEAVVWLQKAADQGHDLAKRALDEIKKSLK